MIKSQLKYEDHDNIKYQFEIKILLKYLKMYIECHPVEHDDFPFCSSLLHVVLH